MLAIYRSSSQQCPRVLLLAHRLAPSGRPRRAARPTTVQSGRSDPHLARHVSASAGVTYWPRNDRNFLLINNEKAGVIRRT